LLERLKPGLVVTSLDVDNALYMIAMVEKLEPTHQRRAIFLGLAR
jgi:predicted tellurium resistance membrane protein TerC